MPDTFFSNSIMLFVKGLTGIGIVYFFKENL